MFRQLVEISPNRDPRPEHRLLQRCRADAASLGEGSRGSSTCPVIGAAAQYAFHALEAFRLPTRLASPRPRVSTRNIDEVRPTTPRALVTPHLCAITHENSLSRSVSRKTPHQHPFS